MVSEPRSRISRCTIDSSALIALDHLDLIPQLSLLFGVVLVPRAVRREVYQREETRTRLQALFANYAYIQECDDYEEGAAAFLLAERLRKGQRDHGEVEAIVQASKVGATVIIDDRSGGGFAESYDLEFHGTLWVLQRFHAMQLLSSASVRDHCISLRKRGIRLPWDMVDEFLTNIGEERLN